MCVRIFNLADISKLWEQDAIKQRERESECVCVCVYVCVCACDWHLMKLNEISGPAAGAMTYETSPEAPR